MARLAESTGRKEIEKQKRTEQASAEGKRELYLASFPNETLEVAAAGTHTYTQKRWTRQNERRYTAAGCKLTDSELGVRCDRRPPGGSQGSGGGGFSDPRPPRP